MSFPALPSLRWPRRWRYRATGPAHVNPVISHRHPEICPDETRGRAIPPARAGADPRPGNNGVAPANRRGLVKPGPLIDTRSAGPDPPNGCGNSACRAADFRARGFRARGHPAAAARSPEWGQDRSTSRRARGFLPLAMPGFLRFFLTGGIAQISARPLRRFPRAFQGGISFRTEGHFVSDFSREKIDQWSQCVAGHENLKRNETQKKRHAEVCKCGGSHPQATPAGKDPWFPGA